MMKKIMLLLTLCAAVLFAADVPVVATKGRPVVDGRVTGDPAWETAPWHGGFRVVGKDVPVQEKTRYKLLKDDAGLWFGFSCVDTWQKSIPRGRDDSIWADDCLEVFLLTTPEISPDPNIREYYHFILNPSNSLYDSRSLGGVNDNRWNAPCKHAVAKTPDGWQAELYVPFGALNLTANANVWRFLIGRENTLVENGKREYSANVPTLKFQELTSYARMTGVDIDYEVFAIDVQEPGFTVQATPDGTFAAVTGRVSARKPGSYEVIAECILTGTDGKPRKPVMKRIECALGKDPKPFVIPKMAAESGSCLLRLHVRDTEKLVWYREYTHQVSVAPLQLTMLKPFYRKLLLPEMPDQKMLLECMPLLPPGHLAGCLLKVSIADEAGTPVFREERSDFVQGRPLMVEYDFAKSAPGSYVVTLALYSRETKLGELSESIRRVGPQRGNVCWLDTERNLVVNGQPFFINGFFGVGEEQFPLLGGVGCNTVHSYTISTYGDENDVMKYLDAAQASGLKAMFSPFFRMKIGFFGFKVGGKTHSNMPPEGYENIRKLVKLVSGHPAFLGWYLYDEPRGADFCRVLRNVYHFLQRKDPTHPVFGCDNSAAGCINKHGYCDIHMPDIYPSPVTDSDFLSVPFTSLFNQLDSIVRNVGREGVIYVPQSFDRDCYEKTDNNYRALNYAETRCSIYAGIVSGVKGILPFKLGSPTVKYRERHPNSGIFVCPDLKLGYLQGMCPEIKAMSPVFMAPCAALQATCLNPDIRLATRSYQGHNFVFAINITPHTHKQVNITWPAEATVRRLCEKGTPTTNGRIIIDAFPRYATHVYTDSPDFICPVNTAAVQAAIDAENAAFPRK